MKKCAICAKGSIMRNVRSQKQRGHYNPAGAKRKYPNLQKTRLPNPLPSFLAGRGLKSGDRILACTNCIKRLAKS